jgi:phage terminase large subunit-like protein
MGQRIQLAPWQKRDLRRIYDNEAGTRRAILSFGRKNGKTQLAACLLLLHLCGPMSVVNSQLYSTAQSREQAALLFRLAAKMVRIHPLLRNRIVIREAVKELVYVERNVRYRALSAEASTAFGLSPIFIVHDELGQVRGPRFPLYEALETAVGAHDNPLSVIISTQAPNDQDLLSILIDDAMTGQDPRTIVSLYAAPIDLDPFEKDTIAWANPALGNFLNETEVMSMAADAARMPSREAEFRNLILNQRVEVVNSFVSTDVWKACGRSQLLPIYDVPVYGGLDLSEVLDLTCLVLIGKVEGVWQVHPTFWLPEKGLVVKAKKDHVPYDVWKNQGWLTTTPGKSVEYEHVAHQLVHLLSHYDVKKIGFDRWNMKHLRPWLLNAGMTEAVIDDKFVEFGQGTQSMSPALRDLESLLLEERINHGGNPIMTMCASNSVVDSKDSANRRLSKKKSTGRIDGMVALAMAIGVAPLKINNVIDIRSMIG